MGISDCSPNPPAFPRAGRPCLVRNGSAQSVIPLRQSFIWFIRCLGEQFLIPVQFPFQISILWNGHFPKVIQKSYGKTLPRTCFGQWILSFSFPLCKGFFIKCWRCSFKFMPEVLQAAEISDYSRHLSGKNFGNRNVCNWICARRSLQGMCFKDSCRCC